MRSFEEIYQTAVIQKGSIDAVESLLPKPYTPLQLHGVFDAHYLSMMMLRVFRAGLKHSLVDGKWPYFETVFKGFDVSFCAHLSDEDIEGFMSDRRLIRHLGKIKSIRVNALMVSDIIRSHVSFGQFIASWPCDDIVGLWFYLKKHGASLGGHSASRFLRMVNKDTFLLTNDVVAVLKAEGIVAKEPTSQRDLKTVQQVFNQWQQESGRSFCEISRIVSMNSF